MKETLIFLLFAFVCLSCGNNNNDPLNNEVLETEADPIVGEWQLVEYSYSIGGPLISNAVENGPIIIFKSDGTYISDREILTFNKEKDHFEADQYENCSRATYKIKDNLIELNFECESGIIEYEEIFNFEDSFLIISPYKPTMCIEGCPKKYKRIK